MPAADHHHVEIVGIAHLVHDRGARDRGPGEEGIRDWGLRDIEKNSRTACGGLFAGAVGGDYSTARLRGLSWAARCRRIQAAAKAVNPPTTNRASVPGSGTAAAEKTLSENG